MRLLTKRPVTGDHVREIYVFRKSGCQQFGSN